MSKVIKCKECGEKVEYLDGSALRQVRVYGSFDVTPDLYYRINWGMDVSDEDVLDEDDYCFECPECGCETNDIDDAVELVDEDEDELVDEDVPVRKPLSVVSVDTDMLRNMVRIAEMNTAKPSTPPRAPTLEEFMAEEAMQAR